MVPKSARLGSGFTIVEMLVVVAVVAALLGLLLPALRAFRSTGRQTVELNAGRHLIAAYTNYAAAHNDWVLPGYAEWIPNVPNSSGARSLLARDATGKFIQGGPLETAKKRYLWRLAPYLNYNLRGLYTNQNEELLEQLEQQDYTSYLYLASLFPSLGLNSEWVGGDDQAYGFLPPTNPLRNQLDFNRYYVTSMAQVRTPDKLMVFGSARGKDPDLQPVEGYFRIQSPYFTVLTGARWSDDFNPGEDPVKFGFLSPRYDGKAVAAFIGGNTGLLDKQQLKDMRHWANWATSENWRLPALSPN